MKITKLRLEKLELEADGQIVLSIDRLAFAFKPAVPHVAADSGVVDACEKLMEEMAGLAMAGKHESTEAHIVRGKLDTAYLQLSEDQRRELDSRTPKSVAAVSELVVPRDEAVAREPRKGTQPICDILCRERPGAVLTIQQAADIAGCSYSHVRSCLQKGLPARDFHFHRERDEVIAKPSAPPVATVRTPDVVAAPVSAPVVTKPRVNNGAVVALIPAFLNHRLGSGSFSIAHVMQWITENQAHLLANADLHKDIAKVLRDMIEDKTLKLSQKGAGKRAALYCRIPQAPVDPRTPYEARPRYGGSGAMPINTNRVLRAGDEADEADDD
jgi:hypothetical protein